MLCASDFQENSHALGQRVRKVSMGVTRRQVGERLSIIRRQAGRPTLKQVGAHVGLQAMTLSRIERGLSGAGLIESGALLDYYNSLLAEKGIRPYGIMELLAEGDFNVHGRP